MSRYVPLWDLTQYGLKIQSGAMQVTNAIFAYPSYENRVESHKGT